MLQLRSLGAVELRDQDGRTPAPLLSQPKRLALLTYLVVSGPAFQRRDRLLALFWPELDQRRARSALRQALYFLRHHVGPVVVTRGEEEVGVARDRIRCDAVEFDDALACKDRRAALQLYRGNFLEAFHLSDSPEFERWLDAERARLRDAASIAAGELATEEENNGDYPAAIECAKRALAIDPTNERSVRQLVELMDHAGDRVGAVREYEAWLRQVATQYEIEPSPETHALVQLVRARKEADSSLVQVGTRSPRGIPRATHRPPAAARRRAGGAIALATVIGAAALADGAANSRRAPETSLPPAVAVLPFAPMGQDSMSAVFAAGLTEDLVTRLSQIRDLRVSSWGAVGRSYDPAMSLASFARSAGLKAVVQGSVRVQDRQVRVTAQLVDAATGQNRWAGSYDRPLAGVFAVQSEVASRIAQTLDVELSARERVRLHQQPRDMRAWELIEEARRVYNSPSMRSPSPAADIAAMRTLTLRALEIDSLYAPAYMMMGAYYLRRHWDWREATVDSALAALDRAIELDPRYPVAYVERGHLRLDTLGDRAAQLADYLKALEVDPSYSNDARIIAGNIYSHFGLWSWAGAWAGWGDALNPVERLIRPNLIDYRALVAWFAGDFPQAEERWEHDLGVLPYDDSRRAVHLWLALLYLSTDRVSQAREEVARARSLGSDNPEVLGVAGLVELFAEDYAQAARYFQVLSRGQPFLKRFPGGVSNTTGIIVKTALGFSYLRSGRTAEGRSLLRQSLREDSLVVAQYDPGNAFASATDKGGGEVLHRYHDIARIHAALGDREAAISWVQRAYEFDRWQYVYTHLGRRDPMLANLRGDPRFERIVAAATARVDTERVRLAVLEALPPNKRYAVMLAQARSDVECLSKGRDAAAQDSIMKAGCPQVPWL